MRITYSPVRSDTIPVYSKSGDVLTINGASYDFSGLTEGEVMTAETINNDFVVADVTRASGVINVTLKLPHGANAPQATRFPSPVTVSNGTITLPAFSE
jgi:hypothetical protein